VTVRRTLSLPTVSTSACLPIAKTGCSGGIISRPSPARRMSPG
jgi:hypothetical protein